MRKLDALVVTVVGVVLLAGCGTVSDQLDGAVVADRTPAPGGNPVLVTRSTGAVGNLVSVVLANDSQRTLRYAEAVIDARTADGTRVTTALNQGSRATCCAVVNLPPGEAYGLYFDVGSDAADVTDVQVSYRDVSWAGVDDARDLPQATVRPVALRHTAGGAVALADLTTDQPVTEAIVQAFVTDAQGKLLVVISGRWTCLRPGTDRLRLQLFHPLPADARIDRVVVHPVTDDPTETTPACGGPAGSS